MRVRPRTESMSSETALRSGPERSPGATTVACVRSLAMAGATDRRRNASIRAFRTRLEVLVAHCPNVTLLPLQPLDRLNDLLNAADIHLLPQRASAADLVMPSRLSAMLASGRPVIATAHPGTQVAEVVEGRGLVVPPEDAGALHAAVLQLAEDKELRLRLGRAAREYAVGHLGKQQVLEQFERDLKSLVQPG